ncbi:TetR/AcrR family transcriptional regulator [Pseudonocardia sp. DSM 110487]|uniref:TetR/AcrR family transcriptional regulator n=1 Tax=Pseudonocardia sp. DSM 110487 TaxID=2865833 RepID=UPI001C696BC5|nr:TetR/AcrR family transcriptional regulator [Pseudonocardia sp. DSM 110487]QYN37036.1 TetR/AcrR family transcriptional regulator [Pseudonocardia sp. DSM 110487]
MTVRNRKVEQGEHTRDALVASAIALFAEKGFADSSTTEIVDRAGITRGALYHHFIDKHQLFEAALDAVEGDIFDRVQAAGAPLGDDVRRRLAVGVDVFLDACLEPAVQRILLQEAPSVLGWERWQRLDRPRCARRLLATSLGAAVDRGLIVAPSAPALTHLVYGALVQAGIVIAGAEDPPATRTILGETAHRLLDSLFRPEV